MKRAMSAIVLGLVSFSIIGCSAGVQVDPDHAHTTTTSGTSTDTSYKKTTVRDANGNIVEQKTEKKVN